jgi:hypothetical protein
VTIAVGGRSGESGRAIDASAGRLAARVDSFCSRARCQRHVRLISRSSLSELSDAKEVDAVRPKTDVELSGEPEQIATAAAERLRALAAGDLEREVELQRRVGEAASRGIATGLSLAAIANAEQLGEARAREELGPQLLRRVERAGRRKREAELEYEEAIVRAGRVGLVHRDVAAAAQVAHGTVRAIIARTQAAFGERAPSATSAIEDEAEEQPADGPAFIDVAAGQA